MGEIHRPYRLLFGKHEGKISFGKCRCRWEDNGMYRGKIGWECVDWRREIY
jgi:hypothetical protein